MEKKTSKKTLIILLCVLVLTGLIAVAIHFGASTQNKTDIDDKLEQIYISVSDDYVNSLFGEPKVSVNESDTLKSNFYLLDNAVLRTVTEDGSVVAFFITSMDEEFKITVASVSSEEIIGETNYSEIDFTTPIATANFSGSGRYNYYAEIQGTGRYAMYNYYVFATLPYGFVDSESAQLCEKYSIENPDHVTTESVESLRQKATPNTFGVIADGYEETITMIPFVEEWENIYYLLTK